MLENRSFDQMLGFLYASNNNKSPTNQPFEGLTGDESNPDDAGREVKVFKIDRDSEHPYLMPGADPGEGFLNTNYQLFRTDDPAEGDVPTNQGFVINFKAAIASDQARHFKDSLPGTVQSEIMGMYTPELLPVMSALARGFAVCDHWFASVPTCKPYRNRAFAAAATSLGHLDNKVKVFYLPQYLWQVVGREHSTGRSTSYNRDPLTRLDYPDTQTADEEPFLAISAISEERAAAGTLLCVYLSSSRVLPLTATANTPTITWKRSESTICTTCTSTRFAMAPAGMTSLLLITYDEHGGIFDHVPPPSTAVPPDDSAGEFGFDFTRFGVRIPALLVSPRNEEGTVFRAAKGNDIDHTSVLKTIELKSWGLSPLLELRQGSRSIWATF